MTAMAVTKKSALRAVPADAPEEMTSQARLAEVLREVNKSLGAEGRVYLGSEHKDFVRVPTGVLAFDMVLGGGLVRGQAIELYGEESSSKSLLSILAAVAIQKEGGVVVWVKGEGSFDRSWGVRNGLDLDRLFLVEAATGDTMLEVALTLLEKGVVDLLVIDSVQSLGTTREMEGGIEAESFGGGGASQMWGRVMRRAYAAANGAAAKTCVLLISQVRSKIGGFSPNGMPDPEPSGVKAIRHWKAISIYCKKGEPIYEEGAKDEKRRMLAREFKLLCKKNKTAATEARMAFYTFVFHPYKDRPFGVDKIDQLYRFARAYDLLEQAGAWLTGFGIRAQGEAKFLEELRGNSQAQKDLYTAIQEKMR